MKSLLAMLVLLLAAAFASAQSLRPDSPYAMKAGINQGTSDSLVGVHYWYFYAMPGTSRIRVRMVTPTTLYGAAQNSTLTITVRDEGGGRAIKTVNGSPNGREATFTAPKLNKRMRIVVSVTPPNQNLLRMGGDYEIEATGNVAFGEGGSTVDPIVRTYEAKTGYNSYGAVKFFANGTIETSTGYRGTWKVFDAESRIYLVTMNDKFNTTVQYIPGYGLVKPSEPNLIEFQELRR
jgi:hypothetical protein